MSDENNSGQRLSELPPKEMLKAAEILRDTVERGRAQLGNLEEVLHPREELDALSPEELKAKVDLLEQSAELERQKQEVDRKAVNLGLLKLADQAPRCSHFRSNGKQCRAPALRNRSLCHFHLRATEGDGPRLRVEVIENRNDVQLSVKRIMEQLVDGRISTSAATALLRGVQIAGETVRPKLAHVGRIKKKSKLAAEENARYGVGDRDSRQMTDEELDAEIAEMEAEIAEIKSQLASASD